MGYEYDDFIDAMRFGLTMSDRDTTDDIWNMVDEVVNKAKAYDQIKIIHDKHIYDFLNMSETECIEKIGDILEDK